MVAANVPAWSIGPLQTEILTENAAGRLRYRLLVPLRVRAVINGTPISGIRVTVPAGFTTDMASIPRFFWRWFPPAGNHAAAAVVHDWLYRTRHGVSRFLADALFRDLMAAMHVPAWKRWCMWFALRLFGWRCWK